MIQFFTKRLKSNKGFTLVELIVVIAILGILAAVTVPRIAGMTEAARKQADISNAKLIANMIYVAAAEGHIRIENDRFVDTDPDDDFTISDRTGNNAHQLNAGMLRDLIQSKYISRIPVSELTGQHFIVEFAGGQMLITVSPGGWADVVYPFPATDLNAGAGANWR